MSELNFLYPALYHAHHVRHLEDLSFWQEQILRQGSPVLELGCGTGRIMLPLIDLGLRVVGLDKDMSMLVYMKIQAAGGDPTSSMPDQVDIFCADMSHFHLDERFATILLTCNTYSTLAKEFRRALLERVLSHLLPQGCFAVSMPNPELLRRMPARAPVELEESFPHPLDGEPLQVSSAWRRQANHFIVTWFYDHLLPNGEVERIEIQASHYLMPVEDYLEEFRQAGFQTITTFGDYDNSPFAPDSPSLIILAFP